MEVERYLVGFQVGMTRDAFKPEEDAGAVLGKQPPGLGGGRGIRGTGHMFPVALAPEPALEPHPLRDDHVVGGYPPCIRAAFPGGSITGAPKVRAMEIIDELEPHRRNAWCGSIGYISLCGTMDTSITIRTLTACGGNLYCSAGGGIVADSQVDAEYQETFDKVNRILKQLE